MNVTKFAHGVALIVASSVAALGLAYGIDHQASLDPTPATVVSQVGTPNYPPPAESYTITEDDPEWNCLTMGNHQCGPEWDPLPEDLYSHIGVSDDEQCVWRLADTTVIVCSDGQVITS